MPSLLRKYIRFKLNKHATVSKTSVVQQISFHTRNTHKHAKSYMITFHAHYSYRCYYNHIIIIIIII